LQLLAGLNYLVLRGEAEWHDVRGALADHASFLSDWVATQGVQTNEVQRCWLLVPCFLEVARTTGAGQLDLVELGPSGGLNLVWDRYAYEYAAGRWGAPDAPLVLRGEERTPVPAELLEQAPRIRSRLGIDRAPRDLTRDDDVALVRAFVWPGQQRRLEQLDRAVEALRLDPPTLIRADLVEALPDVLARREPGGLTVVWQTSVFGYLDEAQREAARDAIAKAGCAGPLAFVEAGGPLSGAPKDTYGLRIQVWPDGEQREVAAADFHGAWLDWRRA
jgi:hypothetical protein